jgi:hypothetical protein
MSAANPFDDFFVGIGLHHRKEVIVWVAETLSKFANFSENHDRGGVGVYLASALNVPEVVPEVFMDVELVTKRVRAEFEEMPGMTLTMPQASRLFGIEREICKRIVERLVTTSYLKWTDSGTFTRVSR